MIQPKEQIRLGHELAEERRQAILGAAFELLVEVGLENLNSEGIARRSGAEEQVIRDHWPSTADILLEAVIAKVRRHIPVPDEGDFAADLRAYLRAAFALGRDIRVLQAFRAIMARAQADEAFGRRFNDTYVAFRRAAVMSFVERAAARGQLPEGTTAATATDLILGTIWSRALADELPLDERFLEELDAVLTGAER